jgi:hypothetical protein
VQGQGSRRLHLQAARQIQADDRLLEQGLSHLPNTNTPPRQGPAGTPAARGEAHRPTAGGAAPGCGR